MIYISALPGDRTALTWPAATARACIYEGDRFTKSVPNQLISSSFTNGGAGRTRPVVGVVNVPPAAIHAGWSPSTPLANDVSMKRVMKGVVQALGFSWEYLDYVNGQQSTSPIVTVDTASLATTTTTATPSAAAEWGTIPAGVAQTTPLRFFGNETVKLAQTYFKCESLVSVPFVNVSVASVVGFDARVLKDELLSVSYRSVDSKSLSAFAVAALVDLNNESYSFPPSSSATTVSAPPFETMVFGANSTCNFIAHSCATTLGGAGEWFCPNPPPPLASLSCSYDYSGRGPCTGRVVSSCLVVNVSTTSFSANTTTNNNNFDDTCVIPSSIRPRTYEDTLRGDYLNTESRCFEASTVITGQTDPTPRQTRCFVSRCDPASGKVQFKVGANALNWTTCNLDGEVLTALGFSGSVTCPKRARFCAAYNSWPVQAFIKGIGGVVDVATTTAAAPSPAPTTASSASTTGLPTAAPASTSTVVPTSPATPVPAMPTANLMQLEFFFYALPISYQFPTPNSTAVPCTPGKADSVMATLIASNASALRSAFAWDLSRLLLISEFELSVGVIRAIAPTPENPTPAGFAIQVAMKPIPDVLSLLTTFTSTFKIATWCSTLALSANYTFTREGCPLSGLRQGAAKDVTPYKAADGGCFVNGNCGTTAALIASIVILVILIVVFAWWRFYYVSEEELVNVGGEESLNVFMGNGDGAGASGHNRHGGGDDDDDDGGHDSSTLVRDRRTEQYRIRSSKLPNRPDDATTTNDDGPDHHHHPRPHHSVRYDGNIESNNNNNPNGNGGAAADDDDDDDEASLIAHAAADTGERHQPALAAAVATHRRHAHSKQNPLSSDTANEQSARVVAPPAAAGAAQPKMSYSQYFRQQQRHQSSSNPLLTSGGVNPRSRRTKSGRSSSRSSSVVLDKQSNDSSEYLLGKSSNSVSSPISGPSHQHQGGSSDQEMMARHFGTYHAAPAPPSAAAVSSSRYLVNHNVDLSEATVDDL